MAIMTMDDAKVVTLLIGAGVTACGTIAGLIIGIINAGKTRQVHTLVNSAMAEQKAENAALKSLIVAQKLEAAAAEQTRKILAVETAAVLAGGAIPAVIVSEELGAAPSVIIKP